MSDLTPTSPPAPSPSPSLWEAARRDYLAGSTAGEICARYGIGRTAFYARAQAGGWRRRDVDHGPPQYDIIEPPDRAPQAARSRQAMAADAMDRADQALRLGRLGEVRGWVRVAAELRRMAAEEAGVETWRETLQDALEREIDFQAETWAQDGAALDEVSDAEARIEVFTRANGADARPDGEKPSTDCSTSGIETWANSPDYFSRSAAPTPPPPAGPPPFQDGPRLPGGVAQGPAGPK
ncbi:MAG: hypothetical protein M3N05_08395 [Pseudomonadota bacterium]|nr:hypothetical protein [Pseudomonadota bacterium]